MKIRIGVGTGGGFASAETLLELVAGLDALGFDSLWLSEVLTGPVVDPLIGLAWAAASNPRLKIGTTALLPGRNVLRLPSSSRASTGSPAADCSSPWCRG